MQEKMFNKITHTLDKKCQNIKNEQEIPKPDNGYLLTMKNTHHF